MTNTLLKLITIGAMSIAGLTTAQAQQSIAGLTTAQAQHTSVSVYNSSSPSLSNGQDAALQPTSDGSLNSNASGQATTANSGPVVSRPATIPADYRVTPFGYFHPSCIRRLAEGDELRRAEHLVRHRNGTTDQMSRCDYPHYRADGETVYGDEQGVKNPNISHSWIVSADCSPCVPTALHDGTTGGITATSFGAISALWSVPYAPTSNDGQTLFFFPGLEDINDAATTILQPVLGWNADFASAWGISSWNCCMSGTTYEATPQQVNSGDTIYGVVGCSSAEPCTTWYVSTYDQQNGKQSLLNTSSDGEVFNWAFAGVLEVYSIAQCTDFPLMAACLSAP